MQTSFLVLNDDALVNATEEGTFAPGEFLGLSGVVTDFPLPERFGKRLKVVVNQLENVPNRLPFGRIVVIDEHSLAAFWQFGEHVIDDLVLLLFRHFVQKEEAADQIVALLVALKCRRIATNHLGPVQPGKFARAVLNLDGRHVGQMKYALRADLMGNARNKITVNVSQLPDARTLLDFTEVGSHQSLIVQEQEDTDHDVAVQCAHPSGIDIRPVVNLGHVFRNPVVIGVHRQRRVILGHFSILYSQIPGRRHHAGHRNLVRPTQQRKHNKTQDYP